MESFFGEKIPVCERKKKTFILNQKYSHIKRCVLPQNLPFFPVKKGTIDFFQLKVLKKVLLKVGVKPKNFSF